MASPTQKLSFWKKGTDKVPGNVKQVYGAQHPPLQHPVDKVTMQQISKTGTPERNKKMTFEHFVGETAEVWDETLSGLSMDSAQAKQKTVSPPLGQRRDADKGGTQFDFDVGTHFVEKVKPRTSSVEDKRSNNSPVLPLSSSKQKPSSLHRKSAPPKLSHKDNKRQPHIQLEDEFPDLIDSESARLERFGKLLAGPNTDINQLKKLSWSGIPPAVRPATWQLLLGYLPANIDRREETVARKRKEYQNLISQYYHTREEELYASTFRQIHIDVPRMNPRVPLFQQQLCQDRFERILYIWAIRRPASGYVQGINDLVTPFFVVYLGYYISGSLNPQSYELSKLNPDTLDILEADSFWCMSLMLDKIQDNYTFAQPGIQRGLQTMEHLIKRIDAPLHDHLQLHAIEYLQFAFRWINNLLMREFPLLLAVRLWDTYLSEGDNFPEFHIYVCVALLLRFSKDIRKKEDFQSTMLLLQNLPTEKWTDDDIQVLLAEAYKLKMIYGNAPGHLRQTNSA